MSTRRKRRKRHQVEYSDVELNIMPFIDVFSMLNTFLLFSAVFLSIGVIEVQIPFLTNAAVPKEDKVRRISVSVSIEKDQIELTTNWSPPPVDEKKVKFKNDASGLKELHTALIAVRRENIDADKATIYSEDDVSYEQVMALLDAVKLRWANDPQYPIKDDVDAKLFLFPKIIMGSVML